MYTCTHTQVASNGVFMSFLDGFTGTVAPQHLPSAYFHSLEKFKPKKKLNARLLWVDVAVKKVGLTLQRQLVEGRAHEFEGLEIGTVFEGELFVFELYLCACCVCH